MSVKIMFFILLVARHRTILRGALDYAVETLDIISVNPADRAKLPKNSKKRIPAYYTAEQLKKLFRAVECERIEAPVKLSATYGLRRSETLGLRGVRWIGQKRLFVYSIRYRSVIEESYGSMESYLKTEMGLNEDSLMTLRKKYTTLFRVK